MPELTPKLEKLQEARNAFDSAWQMIQQIPELQPVRTMRLPNGGEAKCSNIISGGSRDIVIFVTNTHQVGLVPSIFYRSNSQGVWRLNAPLPNQNLSKGLSDTNGYYHYTKATKLHPWVEAALKTYGSLKSPQAYSAHRKIRDLLKDGRAAEYYADWCHGVRILIRQILPFRGAHPRTMKLKI